MTNTKEYIMSNKKIKPNPLVPRPYQKREMNKRIWEAMESKSIELLIADYMHNYASPRERFIYPSMTGLVTLIQDDGYIYNYPQGKVTRNTFYKHKRWLVEKFRSFTIKADAPKTVMIKAE